MAAARALFSPVFCKDIFLIVINCADVFLNLAKTLHYTWGTWKWFFFLLAAKNLGEKKGKCK